MFTKVQILPAMSQGHLLQWTLRPDVKPGFVVSIYRMKPDHTWSKLADVSDTYFFVDSTFVPVPRFDTVYKFVLNGDSEYVLPSFIGGLPEKDRLYIKAIRRREILSQEKGGGRPGFVLKKRSDIRCPSCGIDALASCTTCLGSGFAGGYYSPLPYDVLSVNHQLNSTKATSPVGVFSLDKEVTRGLVYPILEEGDVWVEKFTDRRYFITGKQELTYRGIPIIYTQITMSLVPALSPVYTIGVREL